MDFYNEKCYVEFKRRRCNFGQYPDLMFELCKIEKGLELIEEGLENDAITVNTESGENYSPSFDTE